MGKPAYLHRKNWKDKKLLRLIEHCRVLNSHVRGETRSELCYFYFGQDGKKNEKAIYEPLKQVYYYLALYENKIFGPVQLKPDPPKWCIATQDWELKQILSRPIRNADGNLRRIVGSPQLCSTWESKLGEPFRLMLGEATNIIAVSHQLETPEET